MKKLLDTCIDVELKEVIAHSGYLDPCAHAIYPYITAEITKSVFRLSALAATWKPLHPRTDADPTRDREVHISGRWHRSTCSSLCWYECWGDIVEMNTVNRTCDPELHEW